MILTDRQEHSSETENLVDRWHVPLDYFAFAAGAESEHADARSWFAGYVRLNLEVLKAKLLDRFPRHRHIEDALALVETSAHLPDDIAELTLTDPHFIRWLNHAYELLADTQKDEESVAEEAFQEFLSLPVLLSRPYSLMNVPFQSPALVPRRVAPVGCDWELRSEQDSWGRVTVSDGQCRVVCPNGELLLNFRGRTCSVESHPGSTPGTRSPWEIRPRIFLDRTRTELSDHEAFPFDHFDATSCSLFRAQSDIVNSLSESLDVLQQAWPEAVEHVSTYARVIVPYLPRDRGRHNSCTIRRYLFAQGTDVIPGDELQNLASIIHESMHSKLHVLLSGKVLYWNPNEDCSFAHPWMAIKRPLRGVFLGAHAFLNVLSLYYRVRERVPELSQPADYYFRALAPQVYQAINEMTRGDLTDAGQQFQAVLRRHYEELVA